MLLQASQVDSGTSPIRISPPKIVQPMQNPASGLSFGPIKDTPSP
jgi:hypothetical protein